MVGINMISSFFRFSIFCEKRKNELRIGGVFSRATFSESPFPSYSLINALS